MCTRVTYINSFIVLNYIHYLFSFFFSYLKYDILQININDEPVERVGKKSLYISHQFPRHLLEKASMPTWIPCFVLNVWIFYTASQIYYKLVLKKGALIKSVTTSAHKKTFTPTIAVYSCRAKKIVVNLLVFRNSNLNKKGGKESDK